MHGIIRLQGLAISLEFKLPGTWFNWQISGLSWLKRSKENMRSGGARTLGYRKWHMIEISMKSVQIFIMPLLWKLRKETHSSHREIPRWNALCVSCLRTLSTIGVAFTISLKIGEIRRIIKGQIVDLICSILRARIIFFMSVSGSCLHVSNGQHVHFKCTFHPL